MKTSRGVLVTAVSLGMAVAVACESPAPDVTMQPNKGTIGLRGQFDLSNVVAQEGIPMLQGIIDSVRDANANGGIRGYALELKYVDDEYSPDKALAAYAQWKSEESWPTVAGVFGTNTSAFSALAKYYEEDQVPGFNASTAGSLASPLPIKRTVTLPGGQTIDFDRRGAPFNFLAAVDYSTGARIGMKFAKSRGARKIAFAFCKTLYCTDPIPAAKTYADELGLKIAPDLNVEQSDTLEQVEQKVTEYFTQNSDVDWVWHGNVRKTAIYTARAAKKVSPSTKFIVNVYAFHELVPKECGDACAGSYFGVVNTVAFGDTRFPGMEHVVKMHARYRGLDSQPPSLHADLRYVYGVSQFLVWRKAIEQAIDAGKTPSGAHIREALENFEGFDTGGLMPPVTITQLDHRPTGAALVYSLNAFGKPQFEESVQVELRPEWLGW